MQVTGSSRRSGLRRRAATALAAAAVVPGVVLLHAPPASAAVVAEVEGNNTRATAQSLDAHFSLDADPEIGNSTTVPHATVHGTGDGTVDWYSFTVSQGSTASIVVADIDGAVTCVPGSYCTGFDSYLTLVDGSGALLAHNDDAHPAAGGTGSVSILDSYLSTGLGPGTHYVAVGRCCGHSPDGTPYGPVPNSTAGSPMAYRLHVSVAGRDTTPPVLSLPADLTVEATGAAGAVVTYAATATDGGAAVPVSCTPASGATLALGQHTVSCSATDGADNTATGTFTVTVRDTTPPSLTLPPSPVTATATSAAGAAVPYTTTATDAVSGSVTPACAPASGSTFAPGDTPVGCSATDAAGNTATGSFVVAVRYGFSGFAAPMDGSGVFNVMKAGRAVPVKFGLGGDMGMDVFAAGSPSSQRVTCSTSAPQDVVEETATAGSSALSYDPVSQRYHYVWKTEAAWADTCRRLTLALRDGSSHSVLVRFTR